MMRMRLCHGRSTAFAFASDVACEEKEGGRDERRKILAEQRQEVASTGVVR